SDNNASVSCPALLDGSLSPGASITCPDTYVATQADLDAGSVTNTASASSGNTNSPTDSVTVPAVQSPALSLTKTANPTTYSAVGQTISYSYVLRNTGNVTLSGPFAVTDDKTTATCPSSPTTLAPGASITCTASYIITQAD